MKVILLQEVKGKGHEGDVVEVARGFAVNYLMRRNLAIQATPGNLKQLEARMSNIRKRNDERRVTAEGLAGSIDGKTVVIEARAGDEGKLFGSVTTTMNHEAIADQLGTEVDHRRMDLAGTIKTVGDHPVRISVFGEVKAELLVRVVPEGGVFVEMETAEAPVAEADPTQEPPAEEMAEPEAAVEAEAPVAETADEGAEADETIERGE